MRRENYNLEKEELLTAQMSQREKIRKQVYFSSASGIEPIDELNGHQVADKYYDELNSFSYVSDWQIV